MPARPVGPTTAPGPRMGPRGIPITFTRGRTSKDRLSIDWDYPVVVPKEEGHTVAPVLAYEEAMRTIAGGDPRPLLVLRDCLACQGVDHAVLSGSRLNDRTFLLSSWFHCVKLPTNVMHAGHPLHMLFDGKNMAHLFLCHADGSHRVDLDGGRTQGEIWRALDDMLRSAYADDVTARTRSMMALLDEYDRVDAEIDRLVAAQDKELESNGADTPRARSLRAQLEKACKEREQLLAEEKKLHTAQFAAAATPTPTPAPVKAGG